MMTSKAASIGIVENRLPFFLLILINVFVGSMVGLERTVLPLIGEELFGFASASAALSFIVSFGFSKALVNLLAGALADRFGRKEVLLMGWAFGFFVPLLIIFASAWWMVIVANIFLGINQGLAWSMTVNMKVDLAKPSQRGTAVGLNEFAGYMGLSVMAAVSGYVASTTSLRPEPFFLGFGIVGLGFLLSLFVPDTSRQVARQTVPGESSLPFWQAFARTTWKQPALSSFSFAGLSTNLKDGMAWGLFPLFFASGGLSVSQIGVIVAAYPLTWGMAQLFTGPWSDVIGRKRLIVGGLWLQALSLWALLAGASYGWWLGSSVLLGLGTAMVYPVLIAAVSDTAPAPWRAKANGVYRFWRDSGYAFGALLAGLFVDTLNVSWAIGLVAVLPFAAGIVTLVRMQPSLNKA